MNSNVLEPPGHDAIYPLKRIAAKRSEHSRMSISDHERMPRHAGGREIHIWSRQRGFVHAPFNMALAQTVLLAFPESVVTFWADPSHIDYLQEHMEIAPSPCWKRLRFAPFAIEGKLTIRSALSRLSSLKYAIERARSETTHLLVFADISNELLLPLKVLLRITPLDIPVLVFAHALFEPLCRARGRWRTSALWRPHPKQLRYVVLSEHIRDAVKNESPAVAQVIDSLDHPLIEPHVARTRDERPLTFGFLGRAGKGIERLADMAEKIKSRHPTARFVYAGFARNETDRERLARIFDGVACVPMSGLEYQQLAAGVTYGVWFSYDNHYRFRASGALTELIVLQKPTIYLRNALVDAYFARFGKIGYQCSSLNEVRDRILAVLERFPVEEYQEQTHNLALARDSFLPRTLAASFRRIVESTQRS